MPVTRTRMTALAPLPLCQWAFRPTGRAIRPTGRMPIDRQLQTGNDWARALLAESNMTLTRVLITPGWVGAGLG